MKRFIKGTLAGIILSAVLTIGICISAFAAEATISDDGVNIRSEASTSSTVVHKGSKGEKFTVLETVTASDGATWYKLQINDSTIGYVRGDLVSVTEEAADSAPSEATSSAPATAINPMDATVKGDSAVNIRSGAGTSYSKVTSVNGGTTITITGEANDSDGNKWFQFITPEGTEGYIRNDFVELSGEITYPGEEAAVEEEPVEEEVPEETYEEPVGGDYEIVYTTDTDGVYQYYLYDHTNNTKQKVVDLLEAVNTLNENYKKASSRLSTFKILTILFGALALVAIILAVFFFIRSRNDEYEYYDDDEEEEEEVPPARPSQRTSAAPIQRKERPAPSVAREPMDRIDRRPADRSSERPVPPRASGQRPPVRQRPEDDKPREIKRTRRPQNFLADDDEFEFEFLNMDD